MKKRAVALALLVSIGRAWQTGQAQEPLPKINPDGWTSSAACGECHQAIHAVWQHSLHAKSWSNGVFQAGYRRAIASFGAERARLCLSCHAPTVRHNKDYAVKDPITAEGITCDFCHSVRAVDLADRADPIRLDVGQVKYGPMREAESPSHTIKTSPLHARSEFCAACHEFRTASGVTVLGTYSEWKASPYAEQGRQCQDCHMPIVPGRVVALHVKRETPASVNLHDISGSHNIEKVRQAIKLRLKDTTWYGERLWVFVEAANVGSGHCFPTGLPMHRAVLEVVLRERGHEVERQEIVFEVVIVDKDGKPITREHDLFIKAAAVRSDTRLKPMETRSLVVSFSKARASTLSVDASLFYEYETETLDTAQGKDQFRPVRMRFLVASFREKLKKPAP